MSSTLTTPTVTLTKEVRDEPFASGSTVSFEVRVDGRWVGWVCDEREWKGGRHGARRWSACHREEGDRHARWYGEMISTTRKGAVEALVARVTG